MITLPLTLTWPGGLQGADWGEIQRFYPGDKIRQIERASIRAFMEKHKPYLRGRVLDYGAGQQPYRDLVSGEYVPFEPGDTMALLDEPESYDAVMCNQVFQYVEADTLEIFRDVLKPSGYLVMTYATNWAEVEDTDLWRYTKAGMALMLERFGFTAIVAHELRAEVVLGNFRLALGYGVVCCK